MNKLSNKERKYRSKIIAENHFKKDVQRYLDYYVVENKAHSINITYKYIYLNYSLLHSILTKYNLGKLNKTMRDMGISFTQATNAFKRLSTTWATIQ